MTGYAKDEVLGKNCRFLQGTDREQIGRFKLKEAFVEETECHVEMVNYRKDGTAFFNEIDVVPIKDDAGTVTHYLVVQNDITIRKQKEISLQLDLLNAKRLQQLKDDFTSLASHGLRTPLTSLKATQQLINKIIQDRHRKDNRLSKLSRHAERHTKRLSELVDDLLATTILSHHELSLNKTMFTVAELIDTCCLHIAENGTDEIIKTGNHKLQVYADKHKINQVMANLFDNAFKSAPESKEIRVDVARLDKVIQFSVIDDGIGIPDEQVSEIFLRYKKVNSLTANQSGLGLGLYISSVIIKQHGGEIGVRSKIGQNSQFWFTLPAAIH